MKANGILRGSRIFSNDITLILMSMQGVVKSCKELDSELAENSYSVAHISITCYITIWLYNLIVLCKMV